MFPRTGSQVLLATLSIPIAPVASGIDRFLMVDYSIQDKIRLSNLLRLNSPPTRASLLKDLVRVTSLVYRINQCLPRPDPSWCAAVCQS